MRLIKKRAPSGISGMHQSPTHIHSQFEPPKSVLNCYILYVSLVTTGIYCTYVDSLTSCLTVTHTTVASLKEPAEQELVVNLVRVSLH